MIQKKQIHTAILQSHYDALLLEAKKVGNSLSAHFRQIISNYLKENDQNEANK